jgi:hypothetical protein
MLAAATAVVGGFAVFHTTAPDPMGPVSADTDTLDERRAAWRPHWPAGGVFTYDVEAEGRERTSLGGTGSEASAVFSLRGRLVVRGLGLCEGSRCLRARFEAAPDAAFTLLGQELTSLPGADGDVQIAFDDTGTLIAAGVAPGAPDAALPVVLSLVSALQSAAGVSEAAFIGTEAAPLGTARYTYTACTDETDCVDKRLAGYARVDLGALAGGLETRVTGGGRQRVDPAGVLTQVELDETVELTGPRGALATAHRTVTLRRVAVDGVAPDDIRWPMTALRTPAPAAQRLAQRVGDFTADRLTADLLQSADAATMPDHARWLWRAVGLLRQSPEVAFALPALYARMRPGAPGRALVTDLLAQAGTPASQRALCSLLGDETAARDPEFALHLQRLSFVAEPSPDTVEFARDQVDSATTTTVRGAARLALGALTGAVCARGETGPCESAEADLTSALETTETPEERAELLRALGNAGTSGGETAAVDSMDDDDPRVRAAAALALRKRTTPAARRALLQLGRDPDAGVATTALSALRHQTLDVEAVRAVAALAGEPLAHAGVAEHLALLLAPHAKTLPEARAALERLVTTPETTPAQRDRLRALL